MERAVAAARRAFDTTTWSTDHAFRKECLHQLQAAIESEQEELRAELVAEVGCPVLLTYGPQLDAPLREALTWPAEQIETFPWTRSLGPKDAFGMGQQTEREVWKEPIGVVGRDRAVELPDRDHPQQARPGPRHGQHVRAQAGARHAVERHPPRPAHRREDRHPAGRRQHRASSATTSSARCCPPRPTSTWSPSPAPPPPAGGSWRRPPATAEAGVPRAGRQVGQPRPRRRRPRRRRCPWPVVGVHPRRPGLRHPHADARAPHRATTRPSSWRPQAFAGVDLRRPDRRRQPAWARRSRRASSERVLGYIETGKAEGARLVCGGGVPAHLPDGLLRRADALRRRRQLHDHRPGGDLRAGARR